MTREQLVLEVKSLRSLLGRHLETLERFGTNVNFDDMPNDMVKSFIQHMVDEANKEVEQINIDVDDLEFIP